MFVRFGRKTFQPLNKNRPKTNRSFFLRHFVHFPILKISVYMYMSIILKSMHCLNLLNVFFRLVCSLFLADRYKRYLLNIFNLVVSLEAYRLFSFYMRIHI